MIAISGYDPVAYFTDAAPVRGASDFEYVWHNARWYFASAAHRDIFVADPERYAPQYDGFLRNVGVPRQRGPSRTRLTHKAWAVVERQAYPN